MSNGKKMSHSRSSSSLAKNPETLEAARSYFPACVSKDYAGFKKKAQCITWSPSGKKLASGSSDGTIRIWHIDRKGHSSKEVELTGHKDAVEELVFHPAKDDLLATASGDKTVKVWDTRSGKCLHTLETKAQNINITWSPDGGHIAVGNKRDIISIIDTKTWAIVKSEKFSFEVNEMAWDKTGKCILMTTGTGSVEVLSFPDLEPLHTIQAHTGVCYCIDFDPTGRHMATGGADALVALWDLEELVCVRNLPRLETLIHTVSFSHDGRYLASASKDLKIDIADVETGELVHSMETRAAVNSIAWNPKYLFLAYAGDDRDENNKDTSSVSVFGYQSSSSSSSKK